MKKTIKSNLVLCCILFVLIYSCSKDSSTGTNSDNETQSASDNLFAEGTGNDVTAISEQSEDNGIVGNYDVSAYSFRLSPCAVVSIDSIQFPHHLIINFGNTNCLCLDGKYRRGKILVSYTGRYRDSASTHTIGFDNYYVNDFKVEGSQTVVNKGHNTAGNTIFSVKTNSTITDTAGNTLGFTSDRTREWVAGENTGGLYGWQDDVYSITGTATGTGFTGASFTTAITSPIVFALNCRWIESGKFEFKPAGKLMRTIDFGNGDCDNKAFVSIAGITFPVTLL